MENIFKKKYTTQNISSGENKQMNRATTICCSTEMLFWFTKLERVV